MPTDLPAPRSAVCQGGCGTEWALRMCATCGHVGCCESQAGHAREHALDMDHPVILSLPLGIGFTWCYVEKAYVG